MRYQQLSLKIGLREQVTHLVLSLAVNIVRVPFLTRGSITQQKR